jgi:hypothetical protein
MKKSEILEVALCLDEGHDWRLMTWSVEDRGPYKGSARREKLCMRCEGLKVEHIAWDGSVMNRKYKSGAAYIKASRELSKNVQERRRLYREALLRTLFTPGRKTRGVR